MWPEQTNKQTCAHHVRCEVSYLFPWWVHDRIIKHISYTSFWLMEPGATPKPWSAVYRLVSFCLQLCGMHMLGRIVQFRAAATELGYSSGASRNSSCFYMHDVNKLGCTDVEWWLETCNGNSNRTYIFDVGPSWPSVEWERNTMSCTFTRCSISNAWFAVSPALSCYCLI